MPTLFNALAISGAAMFAGVMLTLALVLGPVCKSLAPADVLEWFAQHSHLIQGVIPVVVLPTIIGLIGSLRLGCADGTARTLWLMAAGCIVAVPAKLNAWLLIHNARIAPAAVA